MRQEKKYPVPKGAAQVSKAYYMVLLNREFLKLLDANMVRLKKAFEDTKGGVALLMSSKSEELSLEDQGLRQGVFTYYVLQGLKGRADANNDYLITIKELYNYVYAKVRGQHR